jgi:hypothetical protein
MPDTTILTPDMAPSTPREKASKLIAIDKKNYELLRQRGKYGDTFNTIISKLLTTENVRQQQ